MNGNESTPSAGKWKWPPPSYRAEKAVADYFANGGSLAPRGRDGVIRDCEDILCSRFDQSRAILHSSGTMALYSAFFAIGLGPGDELICPTVTFHATASPALHLGATVVLVDVEADTGCVDPAAILAAITPRTVAVVTNAQWGHPVDQEAIRSICDRHHLAWIEDISHAHGASWNHRQVGAWGDLACASLGAEKILTGGMGGVLMGSRDDLIDRAVLVSHYLFRSRDDIRTPGFEPLARTGYGLKLGIHPVAAAVVLDQLRHHFDTWIAQREESLSRLRTGLAPLHGLVPPVIRPEVTGMGGWYGFKPWVDFEALGMNRTDLVDRLRKHGVEVDEPGSPPLHQLPLFDEQPRAAGNWTKSVRHAGPFPGATRYAAGTLSLPTYTGPDDEPALQRTIKGFRAVWDDIHG